MNDYEFWSLRYQQQASWSKPTRDYILKQISLPDHSNILEVGCGSLAVLNEFSSMEHHTYGLDIDLQILKFVNNQAAKPKILNADGMQIPFQNEKFALTYCHYLLLWISDPIILLKEMARVTRKNGWLCCFAEPDYLARIDFPAPMDQLGKMQNKSLAQQGVNLSCGRAITSWLEEVNLSNISWGIMGSHQKLGNNSDLDSEWETTRRDLEKITSEKEIRKYRDFEPISLSKPGRIQFIPTFYAYAQKL